MDPHSSPQGSPRGSISLGASPSDPHAELAQLKAQMVHVYAALQQQQQQAASSVAPPQSHSAPRLPKIRAPSTYSGGGGFAADDWLSEMAQQFSYYGAQFPDDTARIRYAVGFLSGTALKWWETASADQLPTTWDEFVTLIRARFRPVQAAMLARQRIGKLRMGPNHSVNSYTSVFQSTLTPIVDMGDADQVHNYVNGLAPHLAAKVWERHPKTLKDAIDFAVSAEAMGHYGRAAMTSRSFGHGGYGRQHGGASSSASSSSSSHVPMDINSVESFLVDEHEQSPPAVDAVGSLLAKIEVMQQTINSMQHGGGSSSRRDGDRIPGLKAGDIEALRKAGKCFRCKQTGHMKNECPQRSSSKSKNE